MQVKVGRKLIIDVATESFDHLLEASMKDSKEPAQKGKGKNKGAANFFWVKGEKKQSLGFSRSMQKGKNVMVYWERKKAIVKKLYVGKGC